MLQARLEQAKSRHAGLQKKLLTYGSLAFFVVLLVGVVMYLSIQLDSVRTRLQEVEVPGSQPPVVTPPPQPQIAPQEAAVGVQQPVAEPAGADFREQFMEQLAQYENETESKINEIRLQHWDEKKRAELAGLKDRAIELFSSGEYLLARENLKQASVLVAQAAAEYAERLATAKREANDAFSKRQTERAEQAVRRALNLAPADGEMLALQKRVAVSAQVLDLLRQVEVARTENRPEKEIDALQKVLALDPTPKLQSRLKALQGQVAQQRTQRRFSNAMNKAQRALDAGDFTEANKQVAAAKAIFPADAAAAALQNKVHKAQVDREFKKQLSLGEQARKRDDWATAAQHFQRARKVKPNDETAVLYHNSARQVVSATQQINRRLTEEHRLGDRNVLASVTAYLQKVAPLTELSPGLHEIHAELGRKLDAYKTEVDVVVVSDNKTHIIVRGVGQVGKTARRTIQLRPGKRVFEGSRSGYKSKLVTVDIRPGAPTVEVVVVCDEKI